MLLNVFTDQKLNDFLPYTFDLEMSHDYVLIAAVENAECTFNNNHKLIKGKFELLRIYLFRIFCFYTSYGRVQIKSITSENSLQLSSSKKCMITHKAVCHELSVERKKI